MASKKRPVIICPTEPPEQETVCSNCDCTLDQCRCHEHDRYDEDRDRDHEG
jgi:hypothetical protein